jgi:hypothetical protein
MEPGIDTQKVASLTEDTRRVGAEIVEKNDPYVRSSERIKVSFHLVCVADGVPVEEAHEVGGVLGGERFHGTHESPARPYAGNVLPVRLNHPRAPARFGCGRRSALE